MIGSVIDGKYRIDKKIGQGAFGTVFQAYDLNLKRDVAVKVSKFKVDDENFGWRFRREAESTAKMRHPNIVAVYDFGEFEDHPYLVMELIDGVPLNALSEKAPIPLGQILNLAVQVCEGMAYAHDQGVIHRDLSLKNIMIDTGKQIRILDFGLAKVVGSTTQSSGNALGTPYFMAPEQVKGIEVDARTDVFAFGVGLFRLINGRFPFDAEHPAAVMYMIINEESTDFLEELPGELKAVVSRCLRKDPNDRYQDFRELAEDISRGAGDWLEATVEIPMPSTSYTRSSKRNPYLNRVMIKDPKDFYGREREIKRIFSRLDAPHPQSISVVGDRRIGKSSLLNYIYQKSNRKQHMQNYRDAIFIYLDLQRSADLTIDKFISILCGMFSFEEKREFGRSEAPRGLDDLKEVIQEIDSKGKRIVILMDEFESITKNKNFDMPFFSYLRFLANNFKVAYVTSSYLDLQQLCHNKDIADSPFFNIFSNLPVRPFSSEDALRLIIEPSKREGLPLGEYATSILDLADRFPLYIQIACSAVFEFLAEREEGEPDWDEISRTYREEVIPHYSFTWDKMDDSLRETLCQVARGKSVGRKHKFVCEDLLRRGYLREENGEVALFSETFKEFILEHGGDVSEGRSFFSSLFGGGRKKAKT